MVVPVALVEHPRFLKAATRIPTISTTVAPLRAACFCPWPASPRTLCSWAGFGSRPGFQQAPLTEPSPCRRGVQAGPPEAPGCKHCELGHIIPLSKSGRDAPTNVQWLSGEEHPDKTQRDLGE